MTPYLTNAFQGRLSPTTRVPGHSKPNNEKTSPYVLQRHFTATYLTLSKTMLPRVKKESQIHVVSFDCLILFYASQHLIHSLSSFKHHTFANHNIQPQPIFLVIFSYSSHTFTKMCICMFTLSHLSLAHFYIFYLTTKI